MKCSLKCWLSSIEEAIVTKKIRDSVWEKGSRNILLQFLCRGRPASQSAVVCKMETIRESDQSSPQVSLVGTKWKEPRTKQRTKTVPQMPKAS